MFGFERLDVYHRSIELITLVFQLGESLPRAPAPLIDELHRAALAVAVSVAKASGATAEGVSHHFGMAHASALGCAALVDGMRALSVGAPELVLGARASLLGIADVLSRLAGAGPHGALGASRTSATVRRPP